MAFTFASLLALTGDIVSLGDVARRLFKNQERTDIERFIEFLALRKVLYAQIDQEIKAAVISSIEEIKRETEQLRMKVEDPAMRKVLGKLVSVMSEELENLWAYDTLHVSGQRKMLMSLQRFRTEFACGLAILCHTYGIAPASTELQYFIVNLATVRPKNLRR